MERWAGLDAILSGMRALLILPMLLAYSAAALGQSYVPDHGHTPGALNPEVTQENIGSTICARGYTKQILPPQYYADKLKKKQMHALGQRPRALSSRQRTLITTAPR